MVKLTITDHSTPELADVKDVASKVLTEAKDSLEQLFDETESANGESTTAVDDKFSIAKDLAKVKKLKFTELSKFIKFIKLPNMLSGLALFTGLFQKLKSVKLSIPKKAVGGGDDSLQTVEENMERSESESESRALSEVADTEAVKGGVQTEKNSQTSEQYKQSQASVGSDSSMTKPLQAGAGLAGGMFAKLKSIKPSKLPKLPKRKPKLDTSATYVTALDVGTEFVKAMIAQVRGDNIEIIGVGRAHQGLADMQSGAISDIAAVVENCEKALAEAEDMAGVQAKKVVVGIAGELVKGTTLNLGFRRRDQATPITSEEMEKLVSAVHEKAYDQARSSLKVETGSPDVDVRLVNSAIVSISVDGYKVTNPIGFQGSIVKVQLYTAFAPLVHIGALERTVRELDLELLAVAAEPFAVARAVVGNDATSQFSAILIDVGGGTTDIAIVDDGGVEGTKMFGIGGRSFTRKLSQDLGVTFERAESLKLHANELPKNPTGNQKVVSESIDNTLEVWKQGVELALSEFHKLEHLPSQIMLCGGGASLNKLFESLSSDEWYADLPFTKKPTVSRISPKETISFSDLTGEAHDHTFITAMGLLRVAADTLGPEGQEVEQGSSIKRKLDTILSN